VSTLAELHAAAVADVLACPVKPCAECGTPMTHGQGTEHGRDVFTEVAADGTAYGPASDLAHLFDPAANWLGADNPYAYLARLGDLQTEAHAACKGRIGGGPRAELTGLFWRVAREYTALMVRLDTGSVYHSHMSDREPWVYSPSCEPRGVLMPYHCGAPAHLRPSGWYCRGCKALLTDDTAELRTV
jgi:hypothetical protein